MKVCTNCKLKPISNSFFKLCNICNQKRLNERKTKHDSPKPKIAGRIKPTAGNKEAGLQKSKLKEEIANERGLLCAGCNYRHKFLTLSHTIPVSLRKDLESEKDNCHLECMGCHITWEHGTPEEKRELLNYEEKIEYIKKVDPNYYERRFKD